MTDGYVYIAFHMLRKPKRKLICTEKWLKGDILLLTLGQIRLMILFWLLPSKSEVHGSIVVIE